MTIISQISAWLAKDKIQRICYLILLIIWLLLWGDSDSFYFESSLGIKYVWLFSIPAVLLVVQIIINKIIVWAAIFGLVLLYAVYSVYSLLTRIIEDSYLKETSWNFNKILLLITFLFILFVVNWIIYKLKPNRR